MPPRYAFWTILIDNTATAFRAREPEELLPTLNQLRRTNPDVVMKWFARGRLWETPAEAQAASRTVRAAAEKRGRDWRPGGRHEDPRDRFKKRAKAPAGQTTPTAKRPEPVRHGRPQPPRAAGAAPAGGNLDPRRERGKGAAKERRPRQAPSR